MPIDPYRPLGLLPLPSQSTVRPMFKTLGIAGSGLDAQRQRMETIAQNIANADVTRGANGQPYKRRDLVLESATPQNAVYGEQGQGTGMAAGAGVFGTSPFTVPSPSDDRGQDRVKPIVVPVLPQGAASVGPNSGEYGVRVAGMAEDQGEGRLVYEPGHPDADATGYVRYPDIDTTQELVKLMEAKRIYEANAAVFQTAKSILRASLDI
jgi:flagellar basal-body rod protein FlgC